MKENKVRLIFVLILALMCSSTSALADDEESNESRGNSTRDAVLIYATAGVVTVAAILGLSTVFKRMKYKQLLAKHKESLKDIADQDGSTALFFAEDKLAVRYLVKDGFDVNAVNDRGSSPLFDVQEPDAVKELLRNGANINMRNNYGNTALFHAYNVDKARELVEAGIDIHARNNSDEDAISFLQDMQTLLRQKITDPTRSDIESAAAVDGQVEEVIKYLSSLSKS